MIWHKLALICRGKIFSTYEHLFKQTEKKNKFQFDHLDWIKVKINNYNKHNSNKKQTKNNQRQVQLNSLNKNKYIIIHVNDKNM